jgi:uncharacterized zinc-type alcohol dehydrogenase-like protein
MGVKIAQTLGADVTGFSHSENKREDAERLGADHFHSTDDESVFQPLEGHVRSGREHCLGRPAAGVLPGHAEDRRLVGSMMGGSREAQEMLDFCAAHALDSGIVLVGAAEISESSNRVVANDVRYRFVIDASTV